MKLRQKPYTRDEVTAPDVSLIFSVSFMANVRVSATKTSEMVTPLAQVTTPVSVGVELTKISDDGQINILRRELPAANHFATNRKCKSAG